MIKVAVLFLAAVFLGGCSLISIDNKTRYSDASGYFDPRLLDQIQPDETTGDWLRQHFGEPLFVDRDFTNPMVADQPVQIETWQFVRQQQKNTRIFLLFSSRKRHEDSEYLHVVLADNKVIKAWRDTFESVDTRRVMGALGYTPVMSETAEAEVAAADEPRLKESVEVVPPAEGVPPEAALEVKDLAVEQVMDSSDEPAAEPVPADFPSLGPPNLGYSR